MKKITFFVLLLIASPFAMAKGNPPQVTLSLLQSLPDFVHLLDGISFVGLIIIASAASIAIYKAIRALIFS